MGKKSERAKELFMQGYSCAQSVFAAYAEDYGLTREQALRLSASFGAGMGRMREVCGALSGVFLVAGLETGAVRGDDAESKQKNYALVQALAAAFRAEHGSIYCRDLLGLGAGDFTDPAPGERTAEYYAQRPCLNLIGRACELLDAELEGGAT